MSFDAVIRSGLDTAFKLLTGLKKDVIFKRKQTTATYNFSNRTMSSPAIENVAAEAVVLKDEKTSSSNNTRKLQLLYKTADVGDLSNFDEVEVLGKTWKIGQAPLSSTGHISFVEIYREVKRG